MMLLCLFALLSLLEISASRSTGYLVLAPNVFHVGEDETVSVTVYDAEKPVNVQVCLLGYPNRQKSFVCVQESLSKDKTKLFSLKINAADFPKVDDPYIAHFAYLRALSADTGFVKEAKVSVSFKNGVILLHTDKPIYTPSQSVKIRVIPLSLELRTSSNNVTLLVQNHQGIVVQKWKDLYSVTGFITKILQLSESAMIGNWTIMAQYGHQNSHNTSVKFEVKKYVLPTFSVTAEGPEYILVDHKSFTIKVGARYTYGKPVQGSTNVKLTIVGGRMKAIPLSLNTKTLSNGVAEFVVDINEIKRHPLRPWFPEGRRLQIDADVIEKATGKRESVIDNAIYFSKSPFVIRIDDTPKYFKPALPFVIKVGVSYPNNKPAVNIPVVVTVIAADKDGTKIPIQAGADSTDKRGRADLIVDVPRGVKSMRITVKTNKGDIPFYQNAEHIFDVSSYYSPSGSFLHLKQNKKCKVGETLEFEAYANTTTPLNYLVMARGKILFQSILARKLGIVSTLRFLVTPAMSPAARLVAYYIVDSTEVVSDSLLLDIPDEFPNKLQLEFHQGNPCTIQVSATPGSLVGLLGVDQSVYLLRNRDKLNKKRAFKLFKALDQGCGVGAGADSQDVFDNSGIVALSNLGLASSGRSESCPAAPGQRKKRSAGASNEDLSKCCEIAKLPYRGRAGCDARARYMMNTTKNCRLEFLSCCKIENNEKDSPDTVRGREQMDKGDDVEEQILDGQIRSYFPETWIFQEGIVGPDGKFKLPVTLPATITTWVLQAMGISNETGFGLAPPVDINTFKPFFVSLSLPYSVQRGEQVSVIATVYNYDKVDCKVRLYVEGSTDFCSTSNPRENSQLVTMDIRANDARSVAFPIVPIKLGQIDVSVFAGALVLGHDGQDWLRYNDAVRRSILVVPEGVERRITQSLVLDPQGILRDEKTDVDSSSSPTAAFKLESAARNGDQLDHVMLSVPNTAIPGSIRASIYLTGNLIGPAVTNLIQGGLDTLLQMPMGCGEQTMMHMAPNVYVLQYLRNSKQVTVDVETRAYEFIQSGYQRELNYRREDRSFSAFGETRPGSTWLTSFVVKVFCAAQKFDGIEVDETLICDSVSWLVENQRQDGAFPEVKNIIHTSMMGGVHGDVAMTAFVLISLLECRCQDKNKDMAVKNAVSFLETEVAFVQKPNVLAIISYALALSGSDQFSTVNSKFWSKSTHDNDTSARYWRVGGLALNIETAAYGLLAQLAGGRLKSAGPIVRWLTEQRNSNGGFASTQDTCVALQALAKYSEKTAGATLNLRVSLSSEMNAHWKRLFTITKDNAFIQRHEDITQLLEGELFIDSTGTGVGQVQIEMRYNVPSSRNETCSFDLSVRTRELNDGGGASAMGKSRVPRATQKKTKCRKKNNKKNKRKNCRRNNNKKKPQKEEKRQTEPPTTLLIDICTRYLKPGKAGMSILDVGIFTGFSPDEASLEELKKNVRPTVDMFEFSDRAVVLYVSEVSNSSEFCISFKVKRVFEVGAVQPVPVKIYDYYEPENSCTKFYSPVKGSELLLGICNGEQCKCTQKGCTPCDIGVTKVHEMVAKVCQDYDFVIKVEVHLVDEEEKSRQSWLNYFVTVKEVLKKGRSKFRKGAEFEFKKRAGCKCPDLEEGKEYMIFGRDSKALNVLDDKAFVMLWEKRKKNKAQLEDLRGRISRHPQCKGK